MIRCKMCGKEFKDSVEYLKFEGCGKEECTLSRKSRARREANSAIEKARNFGSSGGMEQVETKARYVNHAKEGETSFDSTGGSEDYHERETAKIITFHVMKR